MAEENPSPIAVENLIQKINEHCTSTVDGRDVKKLGGMLFRARKLPLGVDINLYTDKTVLDDETYLSITQTLDFLISKTEGGENIKYGIGNTMGTLIRRESEAVDLDEGLEYMGGV